MSTRRPGRPTKYDWDDKRELCFRLFVEEGKSIKDIISHFSQIYGSDAAIPNARDFSRQFSRWDFPSRKKTLDDDGRLLQRVRELFDANHDQQQMLNLLTGEGWKLDLPSLARFRRKHGLMLRVAKGYDREHMGAGTGKKRKHEAEQILASPMAAPDEQLVPDTAARRAQRLATLQIESDAALQTRKRRRRVRGLANLPPDAAGLPPRYKSETSLDECKAFLHLSNDAYRTMRKAFEDICNDMNIIKKRLCSDGEWLAAKHRLIREDIPLSAALNPVHGDIAERENALEVICIDVTKRMRGQQTRITVKDANNILGLNPERSKELRRQFYDILVADHFETKLLCGQEHWEELKQQWIQSSELAQQLYETIAQDAKKLKSVEVLLRDAMKRCHDNTVARISHLTQQQSATIGPGPARETVRQSKPSVPATAVPQSDIDIDPALYAALSTEVAAAAVTTNTTIPAYFRLSPASGVEHSKMWLASLAAPTMEALNDAALSKTTTARVTKISGVLRVANGNEDVYQIDQDEELQVYLEAARETAGGKATFLVVLEPS